ncbi:MAG TPA: multicopper oxidase family protein [Candidatus Dormibacteraeota bacterium]|jgi:suppressor of ftsI|nr:multicopper oxidase family protein [Candidatus Dormibacteraeota bacterium]
MKIRSSLLRLGLFSLATVILMILFQRRTVILADAPQIVAHDGVVSLTLHAVRDGAGRDAFSFNGQTRPPVIRVSPGDTLKITYVNDLPPASGEQCSIGPCHNMTNLHFHGLGVSPKAPQDDVLDMIAMPGQSLNYSVYIPVDQPPGLYWYHTHPHGESERQVLDGMSGAIIVEGIDRFVPQVHALPEKVIVLRGRSIEHDPNAEMLKKRVEIASPGCSQTAEAPERVFTVNGEIRPGINIVPGERQFWRIVNASADSYADVQLDGTPWEIVALDGMPLAYHDPEHSVRVADHVLLPPASRLEAIVTGPPGPTHAALRTRCVDTGPDGDPAPAMVLADVVPISSPPRPAATVNGNPTAAHLQPDLARLESEPPEFVATFTEDKKGFYINGRRYSPDADPMLSVKVGTYQHWRVVNNTRELHPMHLHQVHFYAYAQDGMRFLQPEWLDTVNVPFGGSVDMIVDFTNPVIRGMSVFHCHLLNHEDKGMMAKVLLE